MIYKIYPKKSIPLMVKKELDDRKDTSGLEISKNRENDGEEAKIRVNEEEMG